ncbi:MAG: multiprotein bridging factor aMBF1 [Thermoplasmatota archaeon]
MPTCEMCGKELPSLRRATIEGTVMSVCSNCVRFGVEIAGLKTEVTGRSRITDSLARREVRGRPRDVYDAMEEELVEDYSKIIRDARNRRGLSLEQLGAKLLERVNTLSQVESGALRPSDTLVKKLEKEFGVKLMEKPTMPAGVSGVTNRKDASKSFTLGDMISDAKEKGKKK